MVTIRYNLFALKHQLESVTGRSFPWTEVSRLSGINIGSIKNIAGNKTGRVDLDNLARLLAFFESEGMPIALSDLFTVTHPGDS